MCAKDEPLSSCVVNGTASNGVESGTILPANPRRKCFSVQGDATNFVTVRVYNGSTPIKLDVRGSLTGGPNVFSFSDYGPAIRGRITVEGLGADATYSIVEVSHLD